ncbi:MAG: alpha/beta hydrolase [Deltaproteobacteria bacterium]|nr:alpha/beta hydrolase [Deltaproteobacteria bacterium]
MPTTVRDGLKLRYRTFGDPQSPPLLLVMGLGLSSDGWDVLPDKLSKSFHVITFDNRGTGESDTPKRPFHMGALADDAAAVLDAMSLRTAHVFGISMGGMIAQELAIRHPHRIRRLALGCTFASWLRSKKPNTKTAIEFIQIVTAQKDQIDFTKLGLILTSPEFMKSAEAAQAFARWRKHAESGRARKKAWLQLLAISGHSTWRRLDQITAPTLVIAGDQDRIVPIENSRKLAEKIPHARMLVIPGAGHVFPLEKEAETVQALTEHYLAGEN